MPVFRKISGKQRQIAEQVASSPVIDRNPAIYIVAKRTMKPNPVFSILVLSIVCVTGAAQVKPGTKPLLSPEIRPDHSVVFRINAPAATKMSLEAHDLTVVGPRVSEFTKDEQGVWVGTAGPVPPGSYRYLFNVDGVPTVDPRNPAVSESNSYVSSLLTVPGAMFEDDRNDVPHGAVATVFYDSAPLGRQRRMHIYTPPGYEAGKQRYPVFYLLHGSSDSDASWSSVGRANFILDNLIASKAAVPMIVVMPAGHTAGDYDDEPAADGTPRPNGFAEDFIDAVMPYVEKHYRVLPDRNHTALAGLSMGGGQTINIAVTNPARFGYVGVWSAGVFDLSHQPGVKPSWPPVSVAPEWIAAHQAGLNDDRDKRGLKLLWFAAGADDSLLPIARATERMFEEYGFNPVFVQSTGGHSWTNWRDYLNEFAPKLFK
jgi:enterochelin esterase family protein